jgi:hypothetical protein
MLDDSAQRQNLRDLRVELSDLRRLSGYTLLPDWVIRLIVADRPRTIVELDDCVVTWSTHPIWSAHTADVLNAVHYRPYSADDIPF